MVIVHVAAAFSRQVRNNTFGHIEILPFFHRRSELLFLFQGSSLKRVVEGGD
jgi:hypothetical protein